MKKIFFSLVALAMSVSCSTVSVEFEEGASPEVYFQRAQQASDQNDFQKAQSIYRMFLETGAADPAYRISAEYEIAFLDYKMDRLTEAAEGFNRILTVYENGQFSGLIPDWPRVLSLKVLERMGMPSSGAMAGPAPSYDAPTP